MQTLPKAPPRFNPWFVLAASLGGSLLYAAYVLLAHSGERQDFLLYYFVPIAAPFVAFLLDRAERARGTPAWLWALDLLVAAVSITRAFRNVPYVSGHALFLTYALLTARSPVARWLAALVLLEVFYLKVFVWRDPTIWGGALAAALSAGLYRAVTRKAGAHEMT